MSEYRVEWSMQFEASNEGEALIQALVAIQEAVIERTGATGFIVRNPDDTETLIDIEYEGICDGDTGYSPSSLCGFIYSKGSPTDHCPECGMCWDHCVVHGR